MRTVKAVKAIEVYKGYNFFLETDLHIIYSQNILFNMFLSYKKDDPTETRTFEYWIRDNIRDGLLRPAKNIYARIEED